MIFKVRSDKVSTGAVLIAVAMNLGITGGLIYVVVHFLRKFW